MNAHPAVPGAASAAGPDAAAPGAARPDAAPPAERVIPVIEERIQVARRSAETGDATRVRKLVHERVEPRAVRLRAELAIVERLDPASGEWLRIDAGTASDAAAGQAREGRSNAEQREASQETPEHTPITTQPTPRNFIMYTVIGAFDDRQAAQRAVDKLIVQGFPHDTVDLQSRPPTLDRAATFGDSSTNDYSDVRRGDDEGFLAGMRHFFASLFGTDDRTQAGMYSEAIRRGGSVVVVDALDEQQADVAADVLREQGGIIDLDERSASWRAQGWRDDEDWGEGREDAGWREQEPHRGVTGGTAGAMAAQQLSDEDRVVHTAAAQGAGPNLDAGDARPARRDDDLEAGSATTRGDGDREVVMPVVQEELQVGKRAVERGGVRVVRRVTETPVSELVRLREERARVERRPADRDATSAELENFREGTIEVRERIEEPVVQKVARVVEEVVVGREVDERSQRVEDSVRRTDVEIDRLAREADGRLERASGDAWNDDEVAGGPNPPPGVEPRERSLGEQLKGAARRDERPAPRH